MNVEVLRSTDPVTSVHPPTVSVIIPAYNTAEYIAEALDSVFAQTFTDFEVVVINDGSPDTEQLERALEPYRERIIYIQQKNSGPSAARNVGIRHARGVFIAFLDSDDSWLPQYLSEQLKLLSNSREAGMVYSDAMLFGDSPLSGTSFFEAYPPRTPVNFESLLSRGSVLTSYVVVRKQALFAAGLFDEELSLLEDIHLWLRVAHQTGEILCNRQVLATHRYRLRSQSHVTGKEMAETQIRYLKKLGRTLDLSDEERAALERETERTETDLATAQGKRFLAKGDFAGALRSLTVANRHRPSAKLQLTIYGLRIAPHLTRSLTHLWQKCLNLTADAEAVKARERLLEED